MFSQISFMLFRISLNPEINSSLVNTELLGIDHLIEKQTGLIPAWTDNSVNVIFELICVKFGFFIVYKHHQSGSTNYVTYFIIISLILQSVS